MKNGHFYASYEDECEICKKKILQGQRIHSFYLETFVHSLCWEWDNAQDRAFVRNFWYILPTMVILIFMSIFLPTWAVLLLIPIWITAAWFLFGPGATGKNKPSYEEVAKDKKGEII